MANTISFGAQLRDSNLTNRALRRASKTPGVMYGRAHEAMALQFDAAAATRLVREAGTSHLITVSIEGVEATQDAFIREVQRDPVTSRVMHIDLYAVSADQVVTNYVPLIAEGHAPASDKGMVVTQLVETIEVECLPRDMPASIPVDMTKIVDVHSHITVADLAIPANVTVLLDADTVIAHATMPAAEEVAEPTAEAEAVEAAPAAAEAEAAKEPAKGAAPAAKGAAPAAKAAAPAAKAAAPAAKAAPAKGEAKK